MSLLQAFKPLQYSAFPPQNPINKNQLTKSQQQHHRTRIAMTTELSSNAHQPLDEIPQKDTFAWNTLIRTHLAEDNPHQSFLVFREMLLRGVRPDKHTLPRVFMACRLSNAFFNGKQLHGHALKLGFASDGYVITALIEMYGQLEGSHAAHIVFDSSSNRNSVSWTLLAKLYSMEDKPDLALQVFHKMVASGIEFDSVALATALRACGQLKSIPEGRKVHEIARRKGLEFDLLVGNSLLKMYIECQGMKEARALFEQMPLKDAVTWTTVIGGYVQNGGFNEGLKLFRLMCMEGMRLDSFSVCAVLPACARMAAHKHGKEIHGYIIRHRVSLNSAVQNALMDMYVKSGCIDPASKIFERMVGKDAISWTVMILGYSLHGQGERGVELFREMEEHALVPPPREVYIAALHACNEACMVEEGRLFFSRIKDPEVEHWALMASLLSRAGLFDEARVFVEKHHIRGNVEVQRALLDGCKKHQNVKMGKRIAEQLIELEPLKAENYVLLSNFYAANAKWDMVKTLKETILDMDLKPKKAYSWIEVRSKVHVFGVGDVSHPRSERIYWELEGLMRKMKEEGNVPEYDFSLHDVDEERECIPYGHSEMLAIAFGLISTQKSTIVRVTKNLHVCGNCHASLKIISKIVERDIVLKDPDRFHHFKNGLCSCGDSW